MHSVEADATMSFRQLAVGKGFEDRYRIEETPNAIAQVLRDRFRPFTREFQVDFRFNQLRMLRSQWESANNALLAQVPDLVHAYPPMLTPEYRKEVFLRDVKTVTNAGGLPPP